MELSSHQGLGVDSRPVDVTAAPMSFAQQRLWLIEQIEPGRPTYHIAQRLNLEGPLDVNVLRHAVAALTERHEALRTIFGVVDRQPVQLIANHLSSRVDFTDLSSLPACEQEAALAELADRHAKAPFDLSRGPLIRWSLARLGSERHALLICVHHIIADGASMQVLLSDLGSLYGSRGDAFHLAPLDLQYADFSQWQRETISGRKLEDLIAYWKDALKGELEPLRLPTDSPRRPNPCGAGGFCSIELPETLAASLKTLAARHGCTPFILYLAAFNALLSRCCGQRDFLVASPVSARDRAELEGVIGFFVNTLVFRADLSDDPSFESLLKRTRRLVLDAYAHQDLPFDLLVQAIQPARTHGGRPLCQVALVVDVAGDEVRNWRDLCVTSVPIQTATAKFDLLLSVDISGANVRCGFEYDAELFECATIDRMLRRWRSLLESVARNPAQQVSQVNLLDAEERAEIRSFNPSPTEYPRDRCVHQHFERIAIEAPDRVALVCGDDQITYGQLNDRADRLAAVLRARGAGPRTVVALCLPRSIHAVASMLAILKAGAAYLPIDPAWPRQRIDHMLDESRAVAIVIDRSSAALFCSARQPTIQCDDPIVLAPVDGGPCPAAVTADSLACVIYTSGSTGRPKGVEVTHRGIMRLLLGTDYASFGPQQVMLQLATLCFDASTFEIWGPLLHGGRCVIYPKPVPDLAELEHVIREQGVTCAWLTATLFNTIIDSRPRLLSTLKQVLTGGEALSVPHVRRALDVLPGVTLINGYGPTECTTFACCHTIPRPLPERIASIPIGRPIANTTAHVLDETLSPVPIGVRGELFLGGDGLARGYLIQPELTAEKFITVNGQRLYRTGDHARWLPDGTLEFLGRGDEQVKIRGYRIESGEVESGLAALPGVRQAAVLACESSGGGKRLVGYVVCDDHAAPVDQLLLLLRERLPSFMIPAQLVVVPQLPMTVNGKIDRTRLPAPVLTSAPTARPPVTPTEQALASIWCELLERHDFGIDDDFFDLGGHSLMAVQLFTRIHDDFGRDLPLATLFDHPTVAALAQLIDREQGGVETGPLIPIKPRGNRPPLFLVHGVTGDVLLYRSLVDHLHAEQPLYGLQAAGQPTQDASGQDLPTMAASYIRAMRSAQPRGPYHIGGFSLGGAVAFEMAQQLLRQGEEVKTLLVIDTSPPGIEPTVGPWHIKSMLRFASNLPYWIVNDLLRTSPRRLLRRITGLLRREQGQGQTEDCGINVERVFGVRELPAKRVEFIRSLYQAWLNYKPRRYPGRVTLLRARCRPLFNRHNRMLGWDQVADGGVEMWVAPGSHDSLFDANHVHRIAALLTRCLDRGAGHDALSVALAPAH